MLVRAGRNDSEILAGPEDGPAPDKDWVESEVKDLDYVKFSCFCVNDCGRLMRDCQTVLVKKEEWACSEECAGEYDSLLAYEARMAAAEDFEDFEY